MSAKQAIIYRLEDMLAKAKADADGSAWVYAEFEDFLSALDEHKTFARHEIVVSTRANDLGFHAPEGWQPEQDEVKVKHEPKAEEPKVKEVKEEVKEEPKAEVTEAPVEEVQEEPKAEVKVKKTKAADKE